MKSALRTLSILLLAALPFSLFGQNQTVVIAYMKVEPGHIQEYLEIEQEWKKIHQKAVELGVYNGWQLWRNVFCGMNDPYQFMTIHWYDNLEQIFEPDAPEGWNEGLFSEQELEKLMKKTQASRIYAHEELCHQVLLADNAETPNYILVSRNHIPPGMEKEYFKMEEEILKPLHEEAIRKGMMAHWGIWQTWPYKEGQPKVTIVDGYKTVDFMDAKDYQQLFASIHPDKDWEELVSAVKKNKKEVSVEMWKLIDSVFPEQ